MSTTDIRNMFVAAFAACVTGAVSAGTAYPVNQTVRQERRPNGNRQVTISYNHMGTQNGDTRCYGVLGMLLSAWRSEKPRTRWNFRCIDGNLVVYSNRSDDNKLGNTVYATALPSSLVRQMGFTQDQIQSLINAADQGGWPQVQTWLDNNMRG